MQKLFYPVQPKRGGGDIKAEMVTGITEPIEDRKINLKEAVCIPFLCR